MSNERTQGAVSGAATGAASGGWIGAIIGAVAGYFGGMNAQKAASKLTPQQRQLFDMVVANAKDAGTAGRMLLQLANDPIIAHTNFLHAAANGDRETLMQLGAGDLANISDGARQSLQTMSQLMPRGGASAEFLTNLPFSVARQQQNVLTNIKNQAQGEEGQWGTSLANIGSGLLNQGTAPAENLLGFTQGVRNSAFQQGSDTAGALYDIFSKIGNGIGSSYQNRGSGSGGSFANYANNFFGGSASNATNYSEFG